MSAQTLTEITTYVQGHAQELISIVIVVLLSFGILRSIFGMAVRVVGWLGYYLVGAIPGVLTYFITHQFLGHGTDTATIQGIATALIIGVIGNMMGGGDV